MMPANLASDAKLRQMEREVAKPVVIAMPCGQHTEHLIAHAIEFWEGWSTEVVGVKYKAMKNGIIMSQPAHGSTDCALSIYL